MKKSILKYLTSRLIRKKSSDVSLGYRHAEQVAVLINTERNWEGLKDFLTSIKEDNKIVTTLYYYGKNDPAEAGHQAYHASDIGLFGSIKSTQIHEFLQKKYDYCFILDHAPHPFIEFIAAKVSCQTIIGFVYDDGNQLAELHIKPDHGKELSDLLRYTKQLS